MLKSKEYTVPKNPRWCRDDDKTFTITEKPAHIAERWVTRLYLAMARSGIEIPPEVAKAGYVGLFFLGLKSLTEARYDDLGPLLDELMTCVKINPSAGVVRPLNPDGSDIEEVATYLLLRREVVELHLGFTLAEAMSDWKSEKAPAQLSL